MRYAPYVQEVALLAAMSERELLEYFLTRVFEAEEIWGLDDGWEWITIESEDTPLMPLWPYRALTDSLCSEMIIAVNPTAESLDDFIAQTLPALIEDGIELLIMPIGRNNANDSGSAYKNSGVRIAPQHILEILNGMVESGTYTLDS